MTVAMSIDVTPPSQDREPRTGTFGALGLLLRRRMWRDRWFVSSSTLIVALATLLAFSGPALVARTIDDGAADAVASAGPAANILVTVPVGNTGGDNAAHSMPADAFASLGATVVSNLPERTGSVVSGYDAWVLSNNAPVRWSSTPEAIAAADEAGEYEHEGRAGDYFEFGYSPEAELALVDGRLPVPPAVPDPNAVPGSSPQPTEIAISREVADLFELGIGYRVRVSAAVGENLVMEIVGIVEPADPEAPVWEHFPEFTSPVTKEGSSATARNGTVMLSQETFAGVSEALRTPFTGNVQVTVDPTQFTLSRATAIADEIGTLEADPSALVGDPLVLAAVETGIKDVLKAYPERARAALAQMSIMVAGVVAVAGVVIALMAALTLSRRENDIALERARGASVTSTVARLLAESLLIAAPGVALGLAGALLLTPGIVVSGGLTWVVALVAALSAPMLGGLQARRMWSGRREAANRQDRAKVAKSRRARRLTLEALTIVVAAAAVVSLRGRTVLQTVTQGVDPFLAAAPVLLALAIVVIVVRLYPLPMAAVQFFAKRTRGIAGVITLAKARERIPVLPLLGLTLAIAIALSGGLLVSTVESGQERASWERVGSDVRIDSELTDQQKATLEEQGLTVSRGLYKTGASITMGSNYKANLVAMDSTYPAILSMAGVEDVSSLQALYDAAAAASPDAPIPSLASQELLDADVYDTSKVYVNRTQVPIELIGVAELTPDGWADGLPYLVMPEEQLFDVTYDEPLEHNIALVAGDGAAAAVAADVTIDQTTVTTREEWLAAAADSALLGGVERAIGIAVASVALLAAVALLVTILRGVRERGRALSMLRTQGMSSGYGWWLALAELGPLTLAAAIGGTVASVAIMWLLGDTLGLKLLSGGIDDPPLEIDWTFVLIVGGGIVALLLLAVAAEVFTHRRNKLSEVLRWGESR